MDPMASIQKLPAVLRDSAVTLRLRVSGPEGSFDIDRLPNRAFSTEDLQLAEFMDIKDEYLRCHPPRERTYL